MADEKQTPGYLISINKVTSLSGESIQVSFNMSKESSTDDIEKEIIKLCDALDRRLIAQNEKVLAISQATKEAFEQLEAEANGKIN